MYFKLGNNSNLCGNNNLIARSHLSKRDMALHTLRVYDALDLDPRPIPNNSLLKHSANLLRYVLEKRSIIRCYLNDELRNYFSNIHNENNHYSDIFFENNPKASYNEAFKRLYAHPFDDDDLDDENMVSSKADMEMENGDYYHAHRKILDMMNDIFFEAPEICTYSVNLGGNDYQAYMDGAYISLHKLYEALNEVTLRVDNERGILYAVFPQIGDVRISDGYFIFNHFMHTILKLIKGGDIICEDDDSLSGLVKEELSNKISELYDIKFNQDYLISLYKK